jgi:glutamate decarboxylase
MPLHSQARDDEPLELRPQFADAALGELPRSELARHGMPPDTAALLVRDELLLDGTSRLNLATFVTTWMEPQAHALIGETVDRNLVDKDEYPQTAELERRCVGILSRLWNAPDGGEATGTSTTGSSEACMLGGLALLRTWRGSGRPNLVVGANAQVCWEKFCRYWDVEPRLVPVAPGRTHLTGEVVGSHCDEGTIGVVAIMGSTFDGAYEPVADIAAALDRVQAERGLDIPIHVDAASGGFVAPFLDPDLEWDFRVPRVRSINASGHKYGLVFPGLGWIVWRESSALPRELVFEVDYLGGSLPTFSLTFSRPGAQVAAQYYVFLRLGHEGFRVVQDVCRRNARWLAGEIAGLGPFELLSDGSGIPAFAFRLRPDVAGYTVYDVSSLLRARGWIVPAYPMPTGLEDVAVLRIVVRNGFSRDLARILLDDLRRAVGHLDGSNVMTEGERTGFHH